MNTTAHGNGQQLEVESLLIPTREFFTLHNLEDVSKFVVSQVSATAIDVFLSCAECTAAQQVLLDHLQLTSPGETSIFVDSVRAYLETALSRLDNLYSEYVRDPTLLKTQLPDELLSCCKLVSMTRCARIDWNPPKSEVEFWRGYFRLKANSVLGSHS